MILFRLKCSAAHEFEGWFRDGAACQRQAARGLVTCPECGDTAITKAPMAPRPVRRAAQDRAPPSPEQARRILQKLRRHVETHCENVGERFAEEARRIHRGESPARGIYGEASEAESRALTDDGVEIARIPWVPPSDA